MNKLSIEAFKKPTWQEYYDFCKANGIDCIEGTEVYAIKHRQVMSDDHSAPGISIVKSNTFLTTSKQIPHYEDREKDVQALCDAVLEMSTIFYDNPNGPYENSCPFCCATEYSGGEKSHYTMSELKHLNDCAYLIAKDLLTNK